MGGLEHFSLTNQKSITHLLSVVQCCAKRLIFVDLILLSFYKTLLTAVIDKVAIAKT